ncbi:hypothetical protein J2X98_002185 [Pseudarthrobacter enclensis]|uniref:Uncharacterized protein n=1 Tax=Pseudarthrobacter enclensis TaxID=993070 RepID=A0ABT9RTM4_9MICC|nr:hypothetical protein [Pseudarthrobacter enclensis]
MTVGDKWRCFSAAPCRRRITFQGWQAVFAFAALALVLGAGPLRAVASRRLVLLAGLGAIAALVVDVFLY